MSNHHRPLRALCCTALQLALGLGLAQAAHAISQVDIGQGADAVNGSYINAGSLADTMYVTTVGLYADDRIRFVDSMSLENSPSFAAPTIFDLILHAPTVDVLADVTLGSGTLHLHASTVNLDGVIARSVPSAHPLLVANASTVNVLSNGLVDQGLAIAAFTSGANVLVHGGVHADAVTFASQTALGLYNTRVDMTAGSLESVQLVGASTFNWHGGEMLGLQNGTELFSFAGGVINVYGSNFALNGQNIAAAALYTLSNAAGQLSGILADGRAFAVDYNIGGTLNLISAVPEPQTYVLMLAGLGLVAWRLRRETHPTTPRPANISA